MFSDVQPILKSVSSLQNKMDTKEGFSKRGEITAVITGRDNFKDIIRDEFIKNFRIIRKDGFITPDFTYDDYVETFTGKILDWHRRGDNLTIIIGDNMRIDTSKEIPIPVSGEEKTQFIEYRGTNPADIMKDILGTQLTIKPGFLNSTAFDAERDLWLNGWQFNRVITEAKRADKYLNELQRETNSFIVDDGEQVTFKVFSPAIGQTIELWTDDKTIQKDTFAQKSGFQNNFYNNVIVLYDYDESGEDRPSNFQSGVISADAQSARVDEWGEVKTRTIKSKWIRSFTHTQSSNSNGITIYHVSKENGAGDGTLTFSTVGPTVTWKAPGSTAGDPVTLEDDGLFQIFDTNPLKFIRIVADVSAFATSTSDTITISTLTGTAYATSLANRLLSRYRNPISTVNFEIDINNLVFSEDIGSTSFTFRKPTDFIDITTDEAAHKGVNTWTAERMMITGLRPDFSPLRGNVQVEAIQTGLTAIRGTGRFGLIAHATNATAYDAASSTGTHNDQEHIYLADSSNLVGTADDDPYLIW